MERISSEYFVISVNFTSSGMLAGGLLVFRLRLYEFRLDVVQRRGASVNYRLHVAGLLLEDIVVALLLGDLCV